MQKFMFACENMKTINTLRYWGQWSYQKPEGKSRENCLLYDIWHGFQLPAAQEEFEVHIPNPQVSFTATETQAEVTVYHINLHAPQKFLGRAPYYATHQADR